MKNAFKVIIALFFTFAIAALMVPYTVNAATSPSYPTSIDGLPVILIETPANDISMPSGDVTLVLLDIVSTTIEASTARLDLSKYLKSNPLPNNVFFEVYGGPGVTAEQIINKQKENDELQRKYGVIKLGPIQSGVSPDTTAGPFQVDINNDPSNNNSLDLQSCNIVAPTITGTYEDQYAYLGDNVMTNTSYFLQSGQIYANGQTRLIWADTGTSCAAQTFNLTYIGGDTYDHSIYYYGAGSGNYKQWEMWCFNNNTSAYAYHVESYATGTSLSANINTSVFFENYNTHSNWYAGFSSSTVQANDAYDGGYPIGAWSSDTLYNNVYKAMSGSLSNYGTTTWTLSNIPLGY